MKLPLLVIIDVPDCFTREKWDVNALQAVADCGRIVAIEPLKGRMTAEAERKYDVE